MAQGKSITGLYTDVARTAAVTAGHAAELAGRAASAAGLPFGAALERAGEAVARGAVEVCSRDTPALERCNATEPSGGDRREPSR